MTTYENQTNKPKQQQTCTFRTYIIISGCWKTRESAKTIVFLIFCYTVREDHETKEPKLFCECSQMP